MDVESVLRVSRFAFWVWELKTRITRITRIKQMQIGAFLQKSASKKK